MADPVVLLRHPRSAPDPYEAALAPVAASVQCIPVLAFDISPPPTLNVLLEDPEAYGGLVCTSPRSVQALEQACPPAHANHAAWTAKPVYVVGPRTAEAVAAWGGRPVGQEAGNAEALAAHIAQEAPSRLLFISGNRRRATLPRALVQEGQVFDEVEVYRTRLRRDIVLPDPPAWLAFFSPSGIEAVRASGHALASYACAAIGPTTANALRAAGVTVRAVAAEPTPEALADALRTAN